MKLYFRRSGGYAPSFIGVVLDTQANPGPEASELEQLVSASGIMEMQSDRTPGGRHMSVYTFDFDDNKHVVSIDEMSVPDQVKPLVEFLLARSKNMLPE